MKTNTSSGWNQAIIKTYTWLSHRAIPEKNSNKAIIKTYPLLSHWAIPEKKFKQGNNKNLPLIISLGYSNKNSNREGWGYTFPNPPLEFLYLSLYPLKFQTKQAIIPGNSAMCVTPLGDSSVKNQDPWKFHNFTF